MTPCNLYTLDGIKPATATRRQTGFTHNPHINSSPAWYAHELAIWMEKKGMTEPYMVAMSRGYSIKANGMLFKINHTENEIDFERIK